MNATENKVTYNRIVGTIDDDIYVLDYTFDHGNGFRGAVGSIFRAVSAAEYAERKADFDSDGELWRMAVADEHTTMGHDEWVEWVLSIDGDDAVFDFSYMNLWPMLRETLDLSEDEYPVIECIGGGRCFKHNMPWTRIINPEMLTAAMNFETE